MRSAGQVPKSPNRETWRHPLSKGARARLMGPKLSSRVTSTHPHRETLGARLAGWGHVTAQERVSARVGAER
jgi:hypothetical protein